jgi:hypothetical protein
MHNIIQSEMPALATKLRSIAFMDGLPLTATFVTNAIQQQEAA